MANALKLTPLGGLVELCAGQESETTRIWVRDNRVGIHPDDLPHIFNCF